MKPLAVLMLLMISCSVGDKIVFEKTEFIICDSYFHGKVSFQKLNTTGGFKLLLKNNADEILDQTIFKYIPYQLDTADINRDGRTEILVGLIKATEFDPEEKKRLFILRIDEDQLRPLWLGSRVCQELVNFKTKPGGVVLTIEKTRKGNYAVGEYFWQSFGLVLINYSHHEISFEEASSVFCSNV